MAELKRDCFHCINLRPFKKNKCSISKLLIVDPHNYVCNDFKVDEWLRREEEEEEQKSLKEKRD